MPFDFYWRLNLLKLYCCCDLSEYWWLEISSGEHTVVKTCTIIQCVEVKCFMFSAAIVCWELYLFGVVAWDVSSCELLLIEATTTHYMKILLVLILLLNLRLDILMWLIFFQKAVRSILNIAATDGNVKTLIYALSCAWSAYITVWIKRRGSWILCIML